MSDLFNAWHALLAAITTSPELPELLRIPEVRRALRRIEELLDE